MPRSTSMLCHSLLRSLCLLSVLVALVVVPVQGTIVLEETTQETTVFSRVTDCGVHTTLREHHGGWPACAPQEEQWSGYFDIPGRSSATSKKHYFYWMFSPRRPRENAPVVLWMTGGPGCSSTLAMLVELGPCSVNPTTLEVEENPWSWNEEAYLLFVDQPAGVGFSHADRSEYDRNGAEVGEDMFQFLQLLWEAHPELQESELFVIGESYGGHYAPAVAHRIVEGNEAGEGLPLRLAGLGIGNGLTDPYLQYPFYPVMAYDYCEQKLGQPCVSAEERDEMEARVPRCQIFMAGCNSGNGSAAADACRQAQNYCQDIPGIYYGTGLNPYDIRQSCDPSTDLCYDFSHVDAFLNRKEVQSALGVDPAIEWTSCNMEVNGMFAVDFFKNFNASVAAVLESGVRVMIYAGDVDFICNWIGNKEWLRQLNWSRTADFSSAFDMPFSLEKGNETGSVGLVRTVAGGDAFASTSPIWLTFVQVFNAGHMVPMDQPAAAQTILHHFLRNEPFRP